jgi:hypothetical protein
VIDTLKNMTIQEFQHRTESQLIEVMKMKMQKVQFVSIMNLVRMKLMKGIDKMKNMTIQEFQHCAESRWIEMMMTKMQKIQSMSIVNLMEMKMMKVIYMMKNMTIQEFQYHLGSRYGMIVKNSESPCDRQCQSEMCRRKHSR